MKSTEQIPPRAPANAVPPVPENVEDTALDFGFLADLALKAVSSDANCTTERVGDKLRLPLPITDTLLLHLYREKFIEIRGTGGYGRHRYGMLDRGWERAHRLLDGSGYIGPAPVSLAAYTSMSEAQ
jgi:hypothetical protein